MSERMNSVYFCQALATWPEYWDSRMQNAVCIALVIAGTRGRAKALAQKTTKGHTEYIGWRTQKIAETAEEEQVLPDNSSWWDKADALMEAEDE